MNSKYATRPLLVLFLFLHFNLSAQLVKVAPEKVGISAERLTYLTKTFQDYVDNKKVAGSVVMVSRHGQIAYLRAFGKSDIENGFANKKQRKKIALTS